MLGYWRDEAATREVTTDDGYYRSGDLARIDPDGLVTLQDRQRDLVISGGMNIYPSEVERVLSEHPSVAPGRRGRRARRRVGRVRRRVRRRTRRRPA